MFGFLNKAKSALKDEMAKYNNKEFMEGLCAGAALIAYADGELEATEKAKLLAFFERSEDLSVFDRATLISTFQKFAAEFEFDFGVGQDRAMKELSEVKDPAQRALIGRVLVAIARADGEIEQSEVTKLNRAFSVLGLDAREFIS
jgi:tellurite resistance protein TerB